MRCTGLIVAAVAFVPFGAGAQVTQFEGTVRGTITAEGMEVDIVQHMKGSKLRLDMAVPEAGEVSQIMDMQSGETVMLLHSEKMWMDLSVMQRFMPGMGDGPTMETEIPQIRETGETDKIAGYDCKYVDLVPEGGETIRVCAASGLGCFIPGTPAGLNRGESGSMPGLPQDAERWLEHFADGFFILSLEGGGASYRASEIREGTPEDGLFVPPSDYQEMSIPFE